MVCSNACYLSDLQVHATDFKDKELGGYYIVHGRKVVCSHKYERHHNAPTYSYHVDKKSSEAEWWTAETRSEHLDRPFRSTCTLEVRLLAHSKNVSQHGTLEVSLPRLSTNVPLAVLVLALGGTTQWFVNTLIRLRQLRPDVTDWSWQNTLLSRFQLCTAYCDDRVSALKYLKACYTNKKKQQQPARAQKPAANGVAASISGLANWEELHVLTKFERTMHSELLPHLNLENKSEDCRSKWGQVFQSATHQAHRWLATVRSASVSALEGGKGKKRKRSSPRPAMSASTSSSEPVLLSQVNPFRLENQHKCFYLAVVTHELMMVSKGYQPQTEIDSLENRTVHTDLHEVCTLVRMCLTDELNQAGNTLCRLLRRGDGTSITVQHLLSESRLTHCLVSAFATGRVTEHRAGVFHDLDTHNLLDLWSSVRKLSTAVVGNQVDVRLIYNSMYGFQCPTETPEGKDCGLAGFQALLMRLSQASDLQVDNLLVQSLLNELVYLQVTGGFQYGPLNPEGGLFVDTCGRFLAWLTNLEAARQRLVQARRALALNPDTEIWYDPLRRTLNVQSDGGRVLRALVILPLDVAVYRRLLHDCSASALEADELPWPSPVDLMNAGLVEYLGANEIRHHCSSCTDPRDLQGQPASRFTHLELNANSFSGIVASMNPFMRNNPGPRVTYSNAMAKQALTSHPLRNLNTRTGYHLLSGEAPLVTTQTAKQVGLDEVGFGVHVRFVIAPIHFNMEDAVVINKQALELGLMNHLKIRRYTNEQKGDHMQTLTSEAIKAMPSGVLVELEPRGEFEEPAPKISKRKAQKQHFYENSSEAHAFGLKMGSYEKLDDGLAVPPLGTQVANEDVLIGVTVPNTTHVSTSSRVNGPYQFRNKAFTERRRDKSVSLEPEHDGEVTSLTALSGMRQVEVQSLHSGQIGDKMSSRHGQKGVIGMVLAPEDMPFSLRDGAPVQLIFSPLSLVSRMTVAVLLEALCGKAAVRRGMRFIDRQCMGSNDHSQVVKAVGDYLATQGLNRDGLEYFMDGRTGRMMERPLVSGLMYYNVLHHKVRNKAHARGRGPRNSITGQPVSGRRRDGGPRFGEMERDCGNSHGASFFLKERTHGVSDARVYYVCKKCGFIAVCNQTLDWRFCLRCQEGDQVVPVYLAQSLYVMLCELRGMGIEARFSLQPALHLEPPSLPVTNS